MGFIFESFTLELFGTFVVAIFTAYVYLKHGVYNYWKSKGVPQDEPIVPFGNLLPTLDKRLSLGEYFADVYHRSKKHPFFGVYAFHRPNLVINDPDLIRYILVKDFKNFHDRGFYCNEKVDPLSGHLFLLPGTKWKNLRVKLSPTFSSGKIKYMFNSMKECGDLLVRVLEEKADAKEIIEIKDILTRFSTDVIASVAFGIQCNSLIDPAAEFSYWGRKISEKGQIINAIELFAPFILETFSIPSMDKGVRNFFVNTFNETVSYRKANNVSRNDFLELLMQLMDKGNVEVKEGKTKNHSAGGVDIKLSALEGAAQAYVFFLAGFETSSSTITHCVYELAMNLDMQENLREEIDDGLKKTGGLTYDNLNSMIYLNKFVNETLRKYPSVPILNRVCTEDYTFPNSNLTIPKGTPVVIPVLGIHRDPDIYPNPEKFDPERFSEENAASRHQYAYLPFGEGPRLCIGLRFGMVQTKIALISMLSKYRFKPTPDTKHPFDIDKCSFVLAPEGGMHLQIEKR